jgi:hypothetical protein
MSKNSLTDRLARVKPETLPHLILAMLCMTEYACADRDRLAMARSLNLSRIPCVNECHGHASAE